MPPEPVRIPLSPPHMSGAERELVSQAFDSNYIAPAGPHLDAFEAAMSRHLGGRHCVAVSSGTAALHLALRLLGIGRGDEVWLSSMTFAGGVFPVLYQGATPVFFDLSPESWTLCPDLLASELRRARKRNRLPAAVVSTDLYGQSCDLHRLGKLCRENGVPLVCDCAESLGGLCRRRRCGSDGDIAILSFNGNKIVTTGGGGMLCTDNAALARRARHLATQARDPAPHYQHSTMGYNYRMSNIAAAIGIGQLSVLDQRVAARRAVFSRYAGAFSGRAGLALMPEPGWSRSTRWLSVLTVDPDLTGRTRSDLQSELSQRGIESRPVWKPMHLQPLFRGARHVGRGFDEALFGRGICLPSGSSLSPEQQDEVVAAALSVLAARA
ncbi:MAG: DegT/DnrJ/EryC1/StrS family aminotransferase [Paracoccaceae bacterium]